MTNPARIIATLSTAAEELDRYLTIAWEHLAGLEDGKDGLRAAAYDQNGSGGDTTWCDTHESPGCGCSKAYAVLKRTDPTGDSAIAQAAHHMDQIDKWATAILSNARRISSTVHPRGMDDGERRFLTDLNAEGCASCARINSLSGKRLEWVEGPDKDLVPKGMPLFTALNGRHRVGGRPVCRWCYEHRQGDQLPDFDDTVTHSYKGKNVRRHEGDAA